MKRSEKSYSLKEQYQNIKRIIILREKEDYTLNLIKLQMQP